MDPVKVLESGARELAEVLRPAGFEFVLTSSGPSSGGRFATGDYRRGDRYLELHVRASLGFVTYHVGELSLSHEDMTRAVGAKLGLTYEPEYPGISQDAIDGFRHLRSDLSRFGSVFVSGPAEAFRALKRWVDDHPKPKGWAALS